MFLLQDDETELRQRVEVVLTCTIEDENHVFPKSFTKTEATHQYPENTILRFR